ncbi:NUDE protein [Xylariaceae sp. FL0804]|nr:NUDE protein [Xylariaceae sp. FL0804]
MAEMAEPPSSPPNELTNPEESLAWYKRQYEQLADELVEFRESSHELEAELEKDLDAADKRQRDLQQKAESLQFEVDEWKEKCKKAKTESNAAQNALEKEITTLRETTRTVQHRLRDIEVANDDYERQARNTTSSLEDMESKYNVAIERTVMMEEEIKAGEQEREDLRIESQRLREELSDLKIEAEIMQDKLKKAEERHLDSLDPDLSTTSIPDSPSFDHSPMSVSSSPMISTPPDEVALPPAGKDVLASREPPSPPMSDASAPLPKASSKLRTPAVQKRSRIPSADRSITPKPRTTASTSMRPPGQRSATAARTPAPTRTTGRAASHKIPQSTSLNHIRTLTAQMQRLEARVQNARSKLPAPVHTPPRASPRASLNGAAQVPSTVTMRSRKRNGTAASSSATDDTTPVQAATPATTGGKHTSRLSTSGVSRLSFGPAPHRNSYYDPDGSSMSISRPSSRASVSSFAKPERPASRTEIPRPASRSSLSGSRTPMMGVRPRSSMGNSLHGRSQSIGQGDLDEYDDRTPSRRSMYGKYETDGSASGIPVSSGIPMPRRKSNALNSSVSSVSSVRRISGGVADDASAGRTRKLSDLGETY